MLKKMQNNLENSEIFYREILDILKLKNQEDNKKFFKKASEIQKKHHKEITLESNIYYPTIYKIENNCSICGYSTPESKREYNPKYIQNIIEYKLRNIKKYNITGINCYNKGTDKTYEVESILKILEDYDIDIILN